MLKHLSVVMALVMAASAAGDLVVGRAAPDITLSGKRGGRAGGGKWSSTEIGGKTTLLFYVDPDKRDLNEHVEEAIDAEDFPREAFGSIAVINMEATIIPNWVLSKLINAKQKKYPRTVYVYDKDKVLVKEWGLEDNSYGFVLFDRNGHVLFWRAGKLSQDETDTLVALIRGSIEE